MPDGDLLEGVRVVEYSRDIPAAACAREFARWGANVRTFESPDTRLRDAPPTAEREGATISLLRESLHVGKTLESGDWRAALSEADVLVSDAPLAELNGIADAFPSLVVVHSSPFGTDGPYAEYLADDLVIQALSGFAGTNGLAGREPLAAPAAIISRAIGILGAVAALAALLERMHSGVGDWIELSSHEACSTLIMSLRSEFSGQALPRIGGSPGWAEVMQTADGYITLSPWSKETLRNAPIAFGCEPPPEALLEGDARFAEHEASLEYVRPIVESLDANTIWTRLSELDSVMAMHRTAQQLLDDPQLNALGYFRSENGMTGAGRGMRVSGACERSDSR